MKIAVITDQHFGARSDSKEFIEFFRRYYLGVVLPYLKAHNITTVIDLGDTFDRRKYLNLMTLKAAKDMWFTPLCEAGIELHCLVGNHTAYYRNTNEVNTMDLILGEYPTATVYKDPTIVNFDGLDIQMMPWINTTNAEKCFETIAASPATVLFGHLEIAGFEMYRGIPSHEGYDSKIFDKFEVVASGHYHKKSTNGNIHYLGAPYEMTWSDYDCPRGFHIFDTDTKTFEHIRNTDHMFHKVWYNDDGVTDPSELLNKDYSRLKDTYVKAIVQNKNNPYWFDVWLNKLYDAKPIEVTIADDHKNVHMLSDDDIVSSAEDTLTILSRYVEGLQTRADKKELDILLRNLYTDAMDMVETA